jgi:hypothetical protein
MELSSENSQYFATGQMANGAKNSRGVLSCFRRLIANGIDGISG